MTDNRATPATRRDDFEEQDARYLDRLAEEIDGSELTRHWRQDVAFLQSIATKIRSSQSTLFADTSGTSSEVNAAVEKPDATASVPLRAPEVTDEDVERAMQAVAKDFGEDITDRDRESEAFRLTQRAFRVAIELFVCRYTPTGYAPKDSEGTE